MSEAEFLALEPRERDALVAEKVMGWVVNRSEGRHWHTLGPGPKVQIGGSCCSHQREWSSDGSFQPNRYIADSWRVVEKMREDGFEFGIEADSNGPEYLAWFQRVPVTRDSFDGDTDEAPPAICIAALKARGVIE